MNTNQPTEYEKILARFFMSMAMKSIVALDNDIDLISGDYGQTSSDDTENITACLMYSKKTRKNIVEIKSPEEWSELIEFIRSHFINKNTGRPVSLFLENYPTIVRNVEIEDSRIKRQKLMDMTSTKSPVEQRRFM